MSFSIRLVNSMGEVDAEIWDALFNSGSADNPFVSHAFLKLLEDSGSVGGQSGWLPRHLLVEQEGRVLAAMPLYLKYHSYGEYIFDWSWAEAYERYGLDYYPKLVSAVPFTPVSGPRIAISADVSEEISEKIRENIQSEIFHFLSQWSLEHQCSSWHLLCHPSSLPGDSIFCRITPQFHWFNRDNEGNRYSSFEHFLSRFRSSRRKTLGKERLSVTQAGIECRWLCPAQMSARDWQLMWDCYRVTYLKRSGHQGYLPWEFFAGLSDACPDNTLILQASRDGEVVASALYFKDSTHLYGRYWGALEDIPGLHFELCYYQGIEYCIANRLQVFNAGAQGEHKLTRGFEPVAVHSSHWIARAEFRGAVAGFCQQEGEMTQRYLDRAKGQLPFKNDSAG